MAISQKIIRIINTKYMAWVLCGIFFVAGVFLALFANGTCDSGDSVMHYQFARWSWAHHELLFDHWAKPLYVLIASPFAQFGITGIKLFNVGISTLTLLCCYYVAAALNINRKVFVVIAMAFSPALIIHSLSGLTEPLFALVLMLSVLLYLKNKLTVAIILVSFLPFVRSEA